jgi:hypothetical protein
LNDQEKEHQKTLAAMVASASRYPTAIRHEQQGSLERAIQTLVSDLGA